VEGVPLIHSTTPGERNEARYDSTNEDEIADHIDASELLPPAGLTLIIDVQEDEETCKGNYEGQ
jgi:hypothetical protein